MRTFTIYICHDCGQISAENEKDLSCVWCGAPRSEVEEVTVREVPREP